MNKQQVIKEKIRDLSFEEFDEYFTSAMYGALSGVQFSPSIFSLGVDELVDHMSADVWEFLTQAPTSDETSQSPERTGQCDSFQSQDP